jgi:LCP family protein required for cell wall assembly
MKKNKSKVSATEQSGAEPKKPKLTNKKLIIATVAFAVLLALLVGVIYVINLKSNAGNLFESSTGQLNATPTPGQQPGGTAAATPTPTVNPYDELLSQADKSLMKDIVNVLVIGVDYAQERETWSGKHAYHADVMLLLAINFKENRVDMISLPRDTYAKIPGVSGIYKLNASLDCGGGYPEGLTKVCEAASWMIGGIPVDYYYAVTMPVVKELVDTVGGVDYDLDIDFSLAGRSYKKGMQHMDGQAVLDYLRVRKNVEESGDANRVNRQKKMLIALFNVMKQKGLLTMIPQIMQTFEGKLLTNTTLEQTAALALFAYDLPEANIDMHSMVGSMRNIFNWNFCLTSQSKRVELIEQVYGIKVSQYGDYSKDGALRTWANMRSELFVSNAEAVIAYAEKVLAAQNTNGGSSGGSSAIDVGGPMVPPGESEATPAVGATPTPTPTSAPTYESSAWEHLAQLKQLVEQVNQYAGDDDCDAEAFDAAVTNLQTIGAVLASEVSYSKTLKWSINYEKETNEVYVDFR